MTYNSVFKRYSFLSIFYLWWPHHSHYSIKCMITTPSKYREKMVCWQSCTKKIFSHSVYWSLRKCPGLSQLSKAIG